MKKRLSFIIGLFLLVFLFAIATAISAEAAELTEPVSGTAGDLNWSLGVDGKLIITGSGAMPENKPWLNYSDTITSVDIQYGVTSIGEYAFSGCSNLVSASIPSSALSIGNSAFHNCSSLSAITIPESVTSIGDWTFYNCSSITEIIIPESVTSIGTAAFWECSNLKQITISDSITSIGNSTFAFCYPTVVFFTGPEAQKDDLISLIGDDLDAVWICNYNPDDAETYTIKETIDSSSISWELNCKNGELKIVGSGSMTDFSRNSNAPWYDYRKIINTAFIDGVTTIGNYTFHNCSLLNQVTIPDSVILIGDSAFENCKKLNQITIPSSVTSIGCRTFSDCGSLTQVTIPSSVIQIGTYAFERCIGLTQVTIPSGVTSIRFAFYGCTSLTQVTIPSSVTSIDSAFADCTSLTQITIPSSVTSMLGAFERCTSLTNITIPSGVTSINSAFEGCTSLTQITIPSGVTLIRSAFEGCTSLTQITIPSSVTSMDYAFERCTGLTQITIPLGVTSIDYGTFAGCSALETIIIPKSLKSIENSAFAGCESLGMVYYCGSVEDKENITIMSGNDYLNISWNCNYHSEEFHVYDNDCDSICNVCGFVRVPVHSFNSWYCSNETIHWKECSICGEQKNIDVHTFLNVNDCRCSICHYYRYIPSAYDQDVLQISVESKKAVAGNNFSVTVSVTNNPGFAYLEITPVYSSALTLVSVENGAFVSDFEEGNQYIWLSEENINSSGVLMTLTFTASEDIPLEVYDIGFVVRTCADDNENIVYTYVNTGHIEVINFIYGDVNNDGIINGQDLVRLKKYLANFNYKTGQSTYEIGQGADANGDGAINGQDVVRLKKYLANYDFSTGTSTIELGPKA